MSQLSEEQELIEKLVSLTEQGQLVWEDVTTPFSNNAFKVECAGVEFRTEWLQDGNPTLYVNGILAIESRYKLDYLMELVIQKFRKPIKVPDVTEYQKELKRTQQTQVEVALKVLKGE